MKYSDLVFVSKNSFKFNETQAILGIWGLTLCNQVEIELQSLELEPIINEKLERSRNLPILLGRPFIIEHTGFFIDAWNGLPGGLTAQFMDTVGCEGLCRMMTSYEGHERQVRARIKLAYFNGRDQRRSAQFQGEELLPTPIRQVSQIYTAETVGTMSAHPRGDTSFGWDSIFIPDGYSQTYGEMTLKQKNETSPRKKVLDQFVNDLLADDDFSL